MTWSVLKKSYLTVDYPEKYLAVLFVSQHALELCGSVGQSEKTDTLFEITTVGEGRRSKRCLLAFTGGSSGGTYASFPLTIPFPRAVDSLIATAAWNLN